MALELNNAFRSTLGIVLAATKLLQNPSLTDLAEQLLQKLIELRSLSTASTTQNEINNSDLEQANNWIVDHQPNPNAKLRLFCFHYLGGGASMFRQWRNGLSPEIEVCPIQLPGRENRLSEQPFVQMSHLVETLAQVLHPYLDKPFAFYGHSLGALISFELARQLRRQYNLSPVHLFAAASFATQLINPLQTMGERNDSEWIRELPRLIDAPKSLLENADFVQTLLPTIKADSQIVSTYTFYSEAPLDCPISAFAGIQDHLVKLDDISPWQQHTCSIFKQRMFPGNHLFCNSDRSLLLQAINEQLA